MSHLSYSEICSKTEHASRLCLPSLMSTIGTSSYQPTACIFKSHIYISEELCISLRRIYQQSFMEINCCKWSNSCEAANQKASQGQVWEISTITTQSADLYSVCSQSALHLLVHCDETHQESLFFSSVSFLNKWGMTLPRVMWIQLFKMHGQPSQAPTEPFVTNCQVDLLILHVIKFAKWLL